MSSVPPAPAAPASPVYVPAHFAVRDPALLFALVESHAFGQLISTAPALAVSHVPFLLDAQDNRLVCHLAAANHQALALEAAGADGAEVLCIFQGPHGYVSPRWYAKKPAVPTWNYMAVHVQGRARTTRDPAKLRAIVDRLTRIYEPAEGGWRLDDEPENFTAGMLRGIVGIEIAITRMDGKFKLSQNRPNDLPLVIAALRAEGGDANLALADAMQAAMWRPAGG